MTGKTAVVVLTHFFDAGIMRMYQELRAETSPRYEIFVALNLENASLRAPEAAESLGNALFLCNREKLLSLGYPEKCRREGWGGAAWRAVDNVDTIMLSFYHEHPGYAHYWGIEYDVHYEGKWGFLFERFDSSDADLIGAMLDSAAKVSRKVLMPPFRYPSGRKPDYHDAVIGFFPIHRLSNRMLRQIDACYREGWNGHYEFTWGTMAKTHALKIEDIGGDGPYVKPHNKNVFYFNTMKRWDLSPGTFIFRPAFAKVHRHENTLWHPVKPGGKHYDHCPALPESNLFGLAKHAVKTILYRAVIRLWFLLRWRPAGATPVPPGNGFTAADFSKTRRSRGPDHKNASLFISR
jgi:hypothetical protein